MQAPDFEYETIGPFPSWLISIGVVVDEWVRDADVRQRFQAMIAEWYKDLRRNNAIVPELAPRRALTLQEQYAVLGAIQNVVCKRTKELGHWPRAKIRRFPYRWIAAIPWAGLKKEVTDNAARHKAFIETVFHAVEKDIREHAKRHSVDMMASATLSNNRLIRDYSDPNSAAQTESNNVNGRTENPPSSKCGLYLDEKALLVYWNGTRMAISPNMEFEILKTLCDADGAVVGYTDLSRTIDPQRVATSITLRKAPQEVKDLVSAIRKAFRDEDCPYKVENVASRGYRLAPSTE